MPKVHKLGANSFVQYLPKFPANWGARIIVKGWTQEIEPPFRTAEPLILRLPFHKAIVFGRWTGSVTEDEALDKAIQRWDLTDDDFQEENGWTPVPDEDSEESSSDTYA